MLATAAEMPSVELEEVAYLDTAPSHSLNVFPGIRDSFSGALEANCEERLEC